MQRNIPLLLIGIFLVASLVFPVHANPVIPTLTKFYFMENDKPVDSPVNFSLDCYGTYSEWIIMSATSIESVPGQDNVIHISQICPPDGCSAFHYNNPWSENVTSCVLEGEYKGKPFVVRDFKKQYDGNWFWVDDTDAEINGTYSGINSSDSNACYASFKFREDQCNQLYPLQESEDLQKKNSLCWIEAYDEEQECVKHNTHLINLTRADEEDTPSNVVSVFAEYYIVIHPNTTSYNATARVITNSAPLSPVASLYCTLLSFFGAKC
jgi:hypothetical protein